MAITPSPKINLTQLMVAIFVGTDVALVGRVLLILDMLLNLSRFPAGVEPDLQLLGNACALSAW
jgi:hypothetical protein